MKTHFCAGTIFRFNEEDKTWYVLGLTDMRFQCNVKLPGGTNKNSLWETKEQTLVREFGEETTLTPTHVIEVASEEVEDLTKEAENHTKYFFLILKVRSLDSIPFGFRRDFTEPDSQKLEVRWWKIRDFTDSLFQKHEAGFAKAVIAAARIDKKFAEDNKEIVERYMEIYR